jgi:hypothetical protein
VQLGKVLDDLVREAEGAASRGDGDRVFEICHAIVSRASDSHTGDVRSAYVFAGKKLCRRNILKALAKHLAAHKELENEILAILHRAGEEAGELMAEDLAESPQRFERRALFDALAKLQAGKAALVHFLSDPRWYVVRNAAELLGHMRAEDALTGLLELFKHEDERVRRAAVWSVSQLAAVGGTIDPLVRALQDSSAEVRIAAAAGLGARKAAKSLEALVERLEKEDDEGVQVAVLDALGRNGSASAVTRLIEAAEPPGRLFKRKSVAFRSAAAAALRRVDSAPARAALQKLRDDREEAVRSAAGGRGGES